MFSVKSEYPIPMHTHLSGWNFKSHLSDHDNKFCISLCRIDLSKLDFICRDTFVSSAKRMVIACLETEAYVNFIKKRTVVRHKPITSRPTYSEDYSYT